MTNVTNIDGLHFVAPYHSSIWIFYGVVNFIGVILCLALIIVVIRNQKRSTSDILICGVASACLGHSLTCGGQCTISYIAGGFYGGNTACVIEAIAHISSIQTEFACVASMSLHVYRTIVCKKETDPRVALVTVITIWVVSTVVTGLLSLVSPIYLMAGLYCFFAFSSYEIAAWLLPGLLISLGIMIVLQIKIMQHFSKLVAQQAPGPAIKLESIADGKKRRSITFQSLFMRQFGWRSTLFILALVFGWGSALVASIWEFAVGKTPNELVTAVGVGAVSFSSMAPLIFFCTMPGQKCRRKQRPPPLHIPPQSPINPAPVEMDNENENEITPFIVA